MYNSKRPANGELPTTRQLIISTLMAAFTALIVLITAVLPAEYGIDPTGIGNLLNLTKMGEIKVSLEKEVADEKKPSVKAKPELSYVDKPETRKESSKLVKQETFSLVLVPNQGAEVKVKMKKGAIVNYKWKTDGGPANYDVHGDSRELEINYHNYEKGSKVNKEGSLIAAFQGSHGWFWRNRTSKKITIDLKVSGEFTNLKRIK